jgi:hypothetical protein
MIELTIEIGIGSWLTDEGNVVLYGIAGKTWMVLQTTEC